MYSSDTFSKVLEKERQVSNVRRIIPKFSLKSKRGLRLVRDRSSERRTEFFSAESELQKLGSEQ